MNWLFFILLIANLGMFIWLYPQQDRSVDTTQQFQDIGEMLLAREMPAEVKNIEPPEETQAVSTEESPVTAPEREIPALGKNIEPPEETQTDSTVEPVVAPALVETTSPPVPTLKQAEPIKDDALKMPPSVAEAKLPETMQCKGIGVFESRSQAEKLSVQLLALGLKPEITSESRNEQAGYWVLIPPQNNRAAAVDVAKRLDEAGVADLWRFTSGNLAHAVSLGLFRDQERAQARRDQINALGFDSEVRPRYRQQAQYWVKFSFSGVSPITEQKWREFVSEFPGIERSTAKCP